MEYLNIPVSVLDSPEFVGADQIERGTWLCLQRYCVGQENSGVIEDCEKWKDRQWQQLCRVTLREVRRKSRLFRWEGSKLVVFYYQLEIEAQVRAKRLVAQANGRLGGRPVKNPAETQPKPSLVISEKAEGKVKEGNVNTPPNPLRGDDGEGDLLARIKSLRREWGAVPALSAREARVFAKNERLLGMFPVDAWAVIREYLAARLPEGAGNWQPLMLVKFLEDPGGVYGRAKAWKEKQRPALVVVPKREPDGPPASAADIAEFFKKPEPKRMNS